MTGHILLDILSNVKSYGVDLLWLLIFGFTSFNIMCMTNNLSLAPCSNQMSFIRHALDLNNYEIKLLHLNATSKVVLLMTSNGIKSA